MAQVTQFVRCQKCGRMNQPSARKCANCHVDFYPKPAAAPKIKQCPGCGWNMPLHDRICVKCGFDMQGNRTAWTKALPRMLFVAAIAAALYFLFLFDQTAESGGIRAVNLGLMCDRVVGVIVSVGAVGIAAMFMLRPAGKP